MCSPSRIEEHQRYIPDDLLRNTCRIGGDPFSTRVPLDISYF